MISFRTSFLVCFLVIPNNSIINAEDASFLRNNPTKTKLENDTVELATATASFIQHHNLKTDTQLDIHDFGSGQDFFYVNGKKYSLNDLERKEIYAEDATFSLDGKELMKLDNKESSIFFGQQNGDQILVARTNSGAKGQVDSIVILPENGPEIYMESIKPNVLAVIKTDDLHPEYTEFLGKLELKGRNAEEEENHKLSANFNCEQTMLSKEHQVEKDQNPTCSKYYLLTVAIEFDSSFCKLTGNKWGKTKTKIEAIVANASARYEKQGICTKILISNIDGHCHGPTDPYADMVNKATDLGCTGNRAGLLTDFGTYYNEHKKDVERCATHLFFGKEPKTNVIGW